VGTERAHARGRRLSFCAALLAAGSLGVPAGASAATTYTVNTTADNAASGSECMGVAGDCSLRQALDKAASGDIVSVPANATDYAVTSSPIAIGAGVSIVGGGATGTTVTGGDANQIFTVTGGGAVSISAITLTHGKDTSPGGGAIFISDSDVTLDQVVISDSNSDTFGGGIRDTSSGNLTITRSRFNNDNADSEEGGAIDFASGGKLQVSDTVFADNSGNSNGAGAVDAGASGTFAFDRVTFDGNSAPAGSGGAFAAEGTGTIYNSTFVGNSAAGGGGAVFVVNNDTTVINTTFANNTASSGADVYVSSGFSFSVQNSIFADPQGASSCSGEITDNGNNLEEAVSSSCGFSTADHDLIGQSAQLASTPADNGNTVATPGGPPQTRSLGDMSPVIAAGNATGCSTAGSVDERNLARPGLTGQACDIGAFELQGYTLTASVTGSGTVSGGGISCPSTCARGFVPGTQVTLTETPGPNSAFSGWSGACTGKAACTVSMNAAEAVTATFTSTLRPAHTSPPAVTGTVKAGNTLSCSTGDWANGPTHYSYSWSSNGTPIVGATTSTYKVPTINEGTTLTCTVTASNANGAGPPATSKGVRVPVPKVPGCPAAKGRLNATAIDVLRLGMTRKQARHADVHSSTRGRKYQDFFCLTPRGIRVGYASPKELNTLSPSDSAALKDRVIWVSTASEHYDVRGVRPGATIAAAGKRLKLEPPFQVGKNTWYLAPNGASTAVLKVRHGVVEEIGIGDKRLTQTRKAARAFLTSFY
jgi:predicted outer membrane repeat protein